MTFRYFDLAISKYVKEEVSVRYDPRDMSEIFVYGDGKFVGKAFCRELEGKETSLREIIRERKRCANEVKASVLERQKLARASLEATTSKPIGEPSKSEEMINKEQTRRVFKYFYEREQHDNAHRN